MPPSSQEAAAAHPCGGGTPGRRQLGGIVTLGVAHTLQGGGLAARRDALRRTLEQQLRAVMGETVLRRGSFTLTYAGCQAAGAHQQQQPADQGLTLFFNAGGVPAGRVAPLAEMLGSAATLQRLQRSLAGLHVTSVQLAACQQGGIQPPRPASKQRSTLPATAAAQVHALVGKTGSSGRGGGMIGSGTAGSGSTGGSGGGLAALLAAVGGCLSCGAHSQHAAEVSKSADATERTAAARAAPSAKSHAPVPGGFIEKVQAATAASSRNGGSIAVGAGAPPRGKQGSHAASLRTGSSGSEASCWKQQASVGFAAELVANARGRSPADAGGPSLASQRLPPALQKRPRPSAKHQAAAAAALAAGKSVVEAHSASHTDAASPVTPQRRQQPKQHRAQKHVRQQQLFSTVPLKHAGGRGGDGSVELLEAESSWRMADPAPLRRAGSSGSADSLAASAASSGGVRRRSGAAVPRLATAERAAVWQERRPPPTPSTPLHLRAWDDFEADEAALQQNEKALQQDAQQGDEVQSRAFAGAGGLADAAASVQQAAAPPAALLDVCSDLPAAAAAAAAASGNGSGGGSGGDGSGSNGGSSSGDGAATSSFPQHQPERQPSGTRPRGILKTASSLKSNGSLSEAHILSSSVSSTPASSVAGDYGTAAAATAPKDAGKSGPEAAHNRDAATRPDWEPRTPIASPAKPRRHHVGIKLVPMAVSSNESTPRTDALWSPSKVEAPPTPEGIVRQLTQEFEARSQKEALDSTGWPLSYPLATPYSLVRRSVSFERSRSLEHSYLAG